MDFQKKIIELLSKKTGLSKKEIEEILSVPPKGFGDYAFPCFIIAKKQKKDPKVISMTLAKDISASFLEKVVAIGPYINFFLSKKDLSKSVLENIFLEKEVIKKNEKIMVEYSSPNTNKPLHLGHLRNNVLGLAISNLLVLKGFDVIKANLVNDRGIHICKSMLAYSLFGGGKTPESENMKSDHFVGSMYVLFNKMNKEKPELKLEEKAQEMLVKWEQGDRETIILWKKMNDWAMRGLRETYDNFGTKFDEWFYESDLFKKGDSKKIIEEGLSKNIFKKEDNGAIVAVLEPELQNKVLLRGDGTSLYATNELALTQFKFDKFNLDKCIWVVANEQDLYFKQLFKIFEKLGKKWAKQCYHLNYGYVSLTSGKMKSREGTVVDADNLIIKLEQLALKEINARNDGLLEQEKKDRARVIALSAIKFFLLKNDAKKDMVFNPKESISFEGETGPYLQYSCVRAKSILRKAVKENIFFEKKNFELLSLEKEKELLLELNKFSVAIDNSWEKLSLHPICHNLLSIAENFNSYYHETQILKSESRELLNARLSLIEAIIIVLEKGLKLLDIEVLEKM